MLLLCTGCVFAFWRFASYLLTYFSFIKERVREEKRPNKPGNKPKTACFGRGGPGGRLAYSSWAPTSRQVTPNLRKPDKPVIHFHPS